MAAWGVASEPIPPTIAWHDGQLRLLDQRALPQRIRYVTCTSAGAVADAIRRLVVRGAPAFGAAGAFGVALAATGPGPAAVRRAAARLVAARPTAANLAWAVERALAAYDADGPDAALAEAHAIASEDVAANRALGSLGEPLVPDRARVLTHCNAGALACVGYGTAIGIIRAAAEAGKRPHVWVDETRPVLQGARLTAWELDRLGIDHTLIADATAGALMADREVDLVVVGADRVAANGDVVNKIGTYALAVLARHHRVPFVVAAPTSTVDLGTPDGAQVTIEERSPDEVTTIGGVRTAPAGTAALNRAFDVTPARLVDAIVTERGVARPPFGRSLRVAGNSGRPAPAERA